MTNESAQNKMSWMHHGRSKVGWATAIVAAGLVFLGTPTAVGQTSRGGKAKTLYSFTGGNDGGSPYAGLIRDAQGNLYGATFYGGTANLGAVFKVDQKGRETVLYSFTGKPDGEHPSSDLLIDSAGNLYGAAYEGGANGYGAVFKVSKHGKERVLYSFTPGSDGEYPGSGLIQDASGNLYGTTGYGGVSGNGTVFKISKSGKEKILHSFTGSDGQYPFCTLLMDGSGNFYGTTSSGGDFGFGTVFRLSHNGKVKSLHSFADGTDGANPYSGLVQDQQGNFYGTTYYGGAGCQGYDCGTVFKITARGKETVLHAFGLYDGHYPDFGTLALNAAGNLYGTTYAGGQGDMGVVFKVNSNSGKENIVYTFTGGPDEGFPVAGLVQDASGNLYGTTLGNPPSSNGTVFRIKP